MNHAQVEKVWGAYQAGELDRESTRQLHEHLKECDVCQARVRVQAALSKAGRRDGMIPDPDRLERQMARNRDLMVKFLLLLVAAWAVYRFGMRPR